MESIYIEERVIDGVGIVNFMPMPMKKLSPLYRQAISIAMTAGVKINNIDDDISELIGLLSEDSFDKMRDVIFDHMVVNEVILSKGYEDFFKKHSPLLEIPLFVLGAEVYLGKLLKQALDSDSALRKAVVAMFPKAEKILTGSFGSQLSEKSQDLTK